MSISETIHPDHLDRLAVVYVRQSSPHQALANQESLKLQYDLQHRARAAGWDPGQIRVIDSDLGRTGRTAEGRRGFQELVALVNQEQVGIIFAYDVTRLARNCTDWYQLLDLCGYRCCLVGDQDGIYDPATPNGRLILGLKGLISELELHTLRARLTAGLLNKAQRGELALSLPVGLVRDPLGRVLKHPDQEVQDRLELVFTTFLRVKAACQVVQLLQRPRPAAAPARTASATWSGGGRPSRPSSPSSRTPPTPAPSSTAARGPCRGPMPRTSACRSRCPWTSGRSASGTSIRPTSTGTLLRKSRPWSATTTASTTATRPAGCPGPARPCSTASSTAGSAGTRWSCSTRAGPVTSATTSASSTRCPSARTCPPIPSTPTSSGPSSTPCPRWNWTCTARPWPPSDRTTEQVRQAQQQQIERLRYQARLAERQYNQADPDNRLVAAELERRWEAALRELKDAEERLQREQQQPRSPSGSVPRNEKPSSGPARQIPELWRQGRLSPQQKKAFLRCLIDKVVVHRSAPDTLQVRIVWRGGDTTATALPVTVGSLARLSSAEEMEKEILELAKAGQERRGDRGPADAARVSLSQARRRPAQHRPHPPPASSPVPQAQPIASAAHPRLPDRVPDRPRAWGSRRTGSMTGFTTARSRSPWIPRRTSTCSPISPRRSPCSSNSGPASSRSCVFRRVSRCAIEASFDVALENPFRTVPMAQTIDESVPGHRRSGVPAGSHRNGRRRAFPRWDRGRAGGVPAWPGRPWSGMPTAHYPLIPTSFGIRHHHPSASSPSGPARRDRSFHRGNDPDLIVVLPDGRHAAIALSSTDYASALECSPPVAADHLLDLDGLRRVIQLLDRLAHQGRHVNC